jgi:diketogulonate reductase-like aldo/keto reductase
MAGLPFIELRSGAKVTALGQGAHSMGSDPERRAGEIAALRAGLDAGITVVDTAENYGDGDSERLIAEALGGRRDELFLVSKVRPGRATSPGAIAAACDESLRRLGTDRLDLYLLHWPRDGEALRAETFEAFGALVAAGKVGQWGVSNFALSDLQTLVDLGFGEEVAANQILYNLRRRGAENDVIAWCNAHGVAIMAYCPIEQGRMSSDPVLAAIGAQHGVSAVQVALAWLLAQGVLAIPKASKVAHVAENRAAADLELTPEDLARIDAAFPRPRHPVPFDML